VISADSQIDNDSLRRWWWLQGKMRKQRNDDGDWNLVGMLKWVVFFGRWGGVEEKGKFQQYTAVIFVILFCWSQTEPCWAWYWNIVFWSF